MAAAADRGEGVFATPTPVLPIRHLKYPSPCDVSLLDIFDEEISSPTGSKRELDTFDNVTLVAPDAHRCSSDEDEHSVSFRELTTYLKETADLHSRIATFLAGTANLHSRTETFLAGAD